MSHKCIRMLIEDTAKSLADDIKFTYARGSDFNLVRDKKYPFIVLDPLSATPQYTVEGVTNYMKAWSVNMAFYQLDSASSTGDDYKLILDFTDDLVDKFVNKLNFYSEKADTILIQNVNQTPFIKVMADQLTGHILTLTILAQDDFDYCSVSNEC